MNKLDYNIFVGFVFFLLIKNIGVFGVDNSSSNIIHFYQKMIDKTVLIRFTTDFIMRVFGLFYKQKHKGYESDRIIQSIQATLFSRINDYAKTIQIDENNIIEILFEKENLLPIVQHHPVTNKSDVLLNVFFKKIGWDEINVFRLFFVRYLEYYFNKLYFNKFKSVQDINKVVSDVSYVVQELLQNANSYSLDQTDYELMVRHIDNEIIITVENYTDENNLKLLKKIIDDINNAKDLQDLILKYMLSPEKHLGLISSVFNNNISSLNYSISKNNLVKVEAKMKIY